MNKFNQLQQPQTNQPNYADRQFLHTFLAGALLPLVQATITAVMSFAGTLTVLYLMDAIDLLKPALIVAVLVWVLTWVFLQRRWLTLTALEQATGLDLNRDGRVGEERRRDPLVIRLDEVYGGQYRQRTMKVEGVSQEGLEELARGLVMGKPFTEREWTGPGKPFTSGTEGSFRRLRGQWLKEGLVVVTSDKDHRQGFGFSEVGWAMILKLAGVQVGEVVENEVEAANADEEYFEKGV